MGKSARRVGVALGAALGALCLLALTPAIAKSGEAPETKPKLKLDVSTHHGKSPVHLKLSGRIEGLDPAVEADCFIRVDWKNDTGEGFPFQTREEIACPEMEPGDGMKFETDLVVEKPGTYSYRLLLKPKEDREMLSASREVKVIPSSFQVRFGTARGGS